MYNRTFLLYLLVSILSLALLAPYAVENSEGWILDDQSVVLANNNNIEKIDIYEFTGDALDFRR